MRTFLICYRHEGSEWILELKARDAEDAKARLKTLPYADLSGELIAKIPVLTRHDIGAFFRRLFALLWPHGSKR